MSSEVGKRYTINFLFLFTTKLRLSPQPPHVIQFRHYCKLVSLDELLLWGLNVSKNGITDWCARSWIVGLYGQQLIVLLLILFMYLS
jgi:hypothetical protein